jgi:hypothetical protein
MTVQEAIKTIQAALDSNTERVCMIAPKQVHMVLQDCVKVINEALQQSDHPESKK